VEKILVAVPTYGQNDSRFTVTAFMLAKYPGTLYAHVARSMPDVARNALVEVAFKQEMEYILFADDDMVVDDRHPAETLDLLLKEMKKNPSIDVIAPRAYKRRPPYHPCLFRHKKGPYYDVLETVNGGVLEVDALHFAFTLVRMSTFQKISKPWFEFLTVDSHRLGEDISLSRKLKAASCRLMAHTDIEIKHLSDPNLVGQDAYEVYKSTNEEAKRIITP
jgi:hypothetical protein